jgi:S-adenosylmethionine hydrolase
MRPVVALLTDFGVRDHYAGTMKGVVLSICPETTLVDISHDVPPHDVLSASLELAASFKFFPPGTVFLVVVDPGVGSCRRPIAAEAGDYRFVAPDNGVLSAVFKDVAPRRVVELTERRFARPTVSRTFEGRDRFAPAAGWLAKGTDVKALGRTLTDYVRLAIPDPVVTDREVHGEVLRVDRFGNLITNIDRRSVDRLGRPGEMTVEIRAGEHRVGRLVMTYSEIAAGEVCSLFGSTEHLEVAANSASAAETLGLGRGAAVTVTRVGP